jgi:hypothetical protein
MPLSEIQLRHIALADNPMESAQLTGLVDAIEDRYKPRPSKYLALWPRMNGSYAELERHLRAVPSVHDVLVAGAAVKDRDERIHALEARIQELRDELKTRTCST